MHLFHCDFKQSDNSRYVEYAGDGAMLISENDDKAENDEEIKLTVHVEGECMH